MSEFQERCGFVRFDDYAGYREVHVRVFGETPKRYRCRWDNGRVRLVPKRAIRLLLVDECITHDTRSSRGTGGMA